MSSREVMNPILRSVDRLDSIAREFGGEIRGSENAVWDVDLDGFDLEVQFDSSGNVSSFTVRDAGKVVQQQDRVDFRMFEKMIRDLVGPKEPVDSAPTVIDSQGVDVEPTRGYQGIDPDEPTMKKQGS